MRHLERAHNILHTCLNMNMNYSHAQIGKKNIDWEIGDEETGCKGESTNEKW